MGRTMAKNTFQYVEGHVDQKRFEDALDFLIAIEPDPEEFSEKCVRLGLDEGEEYEKIRQEYAESIRCVKLAIQQYARQITPPTVEAMQDVFYRIVRSPKYQSSTVAASVCYSSLNRYWAGINGWRH